MQEKKTKDDLMEKMTSLCKRRGFIFQSSEIYGGLNSCWDYGPLGVELKRNIKNFWWQSMVITRDDIVGIDASILMHPNVWKASGHVAGFTDPLVDCKKCKQRFRADHIQGKVCPSCGGELSEARKFNLMFKTFLGPVEEEAASVYLRPETAQGIFVNFKNVLNSSRMKIPFGIAQIGKSFRNEITPGNFTYRTREFEQMEMEFFVEPGSDEAWFEYWKNERLRWYLDLGIEKEHLRLRDHRVDELAHYAKACVDVEYLFPFGWSELEGIANRTDFDLKQHSAAAGKDLTYFEEQVQGAQRYHPFVIEPAAGADRATLAVLVDAYHEEVVEGENRVVMRLHPRIAPVKAAVLPLVKKEQMPEIAEKIKKQISRYFYAEMDVNSSIGRRYRRQDEIGTPFVITVDGQTLQDETVTVRERDSMNQSRIKIGELIEFLTKKIIGEV